MTSRPLTTVLGAMALVVLAGPALAQSIDLSPVQTLLQGIADTLADRLHRSDFSGRTLTLKIKLADFTLVSRRTTLGHVLKDADEIRRLALTLLDRPGPPPAPVRLLGLGVSTGAGDEDRRQLHFDL